MNILVDAHVFDGKYQGTRSYLKGLYSALISMAPPKWIFFIAANKIDNLKKEFGEHTNIKYIKLNNNKFYRLLLEIPYIIKKNNIDFAHFQYIVPPFKNCKQIVTIHDILFEQSEFKKFFPLKYRIINGILFKMSVRRSDILLTVSNYSREKISELYNVDLSEIHVTPNSVEIDFKKIEITSKTFKGEKFILYVSRIEPRKNHIILLKAFFELELYKKGYLLVFVGSKDFVDKQLLKYINKNKELVKQHVVWKSDLTLNQIKLCYYNCSLFVFPSVAEGFGIPIMEAMVFNKKIIISNQTAMKDFNLPPELTFNPYDVDELKNKLMNMLSNKKDYKELYMNILSEFKWEKSAEKMIHLINQFI
ncbi:glycosyltransferase family 4 protein [Abyssalbus ytuae]|uniref:Glycosyltransferase family 4 protein n=1 Tax=Abyssalbus ytuae TaxID=2926907 RepID=A0A9E6ZX88_9FLAO|nr:glycosyltransferase family 1 protein [Abyssalbus ytuae]UOB19423.1 glycosyltransferase family 4 protein [Abyssalbus ytuae]